MKGGLDIYRTGRKKEKLKGGTGCTSLDFRRRVWARDYRCTSWMVRTAGYKIEVLRTSASFAPSLRRTRACS